MRAAIEKLFAGLRVLMIVSLAAWAPLDCCCPAGEASPATPRAAGAATAASRVDRSTGCSMCERPVAGRASTDSSSPWTPRPCPHGGPSFELIPASSASNLALTLDSPGPAPIGSVTLSATSLLPSALAPAATLHAALPPPPDISLLSQHCMLTV